MAIRDASQRRAFTLIELMIVVTIVGVLIILAVFGVRKYVQHSKSAEAMHALGHMGKLAVKSYETPQVSNKISADCFTCVVANTVCGSAKYPVPSAFTDVQAKKYQSSTSDWMNTADVSTRAGFPCLGFAMSEPQYFQYDYVGTSTAMTAIAHGDLDGNGISSSYQLVGAVQNGHFVLAPGFQIVNDGE